MTFEITGRIIAIHELSDKSAQVVIKKVIARKQVPIAINVFGYYKQKMDEMKLQKNEKICGKVFLKSNLHKNRWYTDVYFKNIERVIDKGKENKKDSDLFSETNESFIFENNNIVDFETGEVML